MKMEPIVSSETSAIRTQTPGNYPKRNKLQPEDGPHVRPKHVVVRTLIILIIEVNIVVFDCVFSTRNSLPLYPVTWLTVHT